MFVLPSGKKFDVGFKALRVFEATSNTARSLLLLLSSLFWSRWQTKVLPVIRRGMGTIPSLTALSTPRRVPIFLYGLSWRFPSLP